MVLDNDAVDTCLIVGSITDEGGEWNWDLVEQGPDLRAIINITTCQLRGEDLSSLSVHPDVQLAPGSAPSGATLLDQPLTRSTQPQTCAVHQQVERSSGAWTSLRDLLGFSPPAQGRVIRHRQIQPQELENRTDLSQTLRQPVQPMPPASSGGA